jgi:hypothetical protein
VGSAAGKDFGPLFDQLRAILARSADGMDLVHDQPGNYYLNTRHVRKDGYVFMFGAVQIKARYVAYHLMPIYNSELLAGLSEPLRKRMQGKACFNFTRYDEQPAPQPTPAGPTFTARPAAAPGPAGLAHCTLTGPISPTALAYLSCDAVLQAVLLTSSGAVLDLGRTVRTASAAQRRALAARDRGCVVPGCSAPPEHCEAHHVRWWRNGGETDLDNLALVCLRHHTDIHHGVWQLEMIDGLAWARPPRWLNPDRPLLRNTVHLAMDHAHRLGQQLRLDLDDTG